MQPSICVQHHPLRAHLLAALRERLGEFELVSDPEPEGERSPLRTYRECLRRTPPSATHRLVLQDDCWPCEDFCERAQEAVAERPDHLIAFFVPGTPGGGGDRMLRAARNGERWVQIGGAGWVPTVALCWPRALIAPFLDFAGTSRFAHQRGDDNVVGQFARTNRLQVWATVPSLVEHPDIEPSLIGRKNRAGQNRSRVAALYCG